MERTLELTSMKELPKGSEITHHQWTCSIHFVLLFFFLFFCSIHFYNSFLFLSQGLSIAPSHTCPTFHFTAIQTSGILYLFSAAILYIQIIKQSLLIHPALQPLLGSEPKLTSLSFEILSSCRLSATFPFQVLYFRISLSQKANPHQVRAQLGINKGDELGSEKQPTHRKQKF